MIRREHSRPLGFRGFIHHDVLETSEEKLQAIITYLDKGIGDTLEFLGRTGEQVPMIHTNFGEIGYSYPDNAIDVPIPVLESWFWSRKPLEEIEVTLFDAPNFLGHLSMSVPLERYLVLAGRAETIHFFQRNGDENLAVTIDGPPPRELSGLGHWLCDIEVESRGVLDRICGSMGEEPVWMKVNEALSSLYPQRYGKPISVLLTSGFRISGLE